MKALLIGTARQWLPWFTLPLGILLLANLPEGWAGLIEAFLGGAFLGHGLTGIIDQEIEEHNHG